MTGLLTLQEFYASILNKGTMEQFSHLSRMSHFNVFKRGQIQCARITELHRTDFHKISLIIGDGIVHFEDSKVRVSGKTLIFYHRNVPHVWEPVSEEQQGYFCLFNTQFIDTYLLDNLFRDTPLMNTAMNPVYPLTDEQAAQIEFIFKQMHDEMDGNYIKKYEIIVHYLHILLHQTNKLRFQNIHEDKKPAASVVLTTLFMEMLERQFPIDSSDQSLALKKPSEFAEKLAIHVNHLNRSIKEVTGKSTTEIISSRLANEAKALLRHTDNSVAEIAYTLGFEHPSNFNSFFKKQTTLTPRSFREGT
ncbi:AraC family transcriptional regulator [Fluviicola sp.]|uniref:helix-turn-helix domain-containing protein n=1 Tax=Fluviicola sp. TaxID=1917219 RepID=UPI0031DBC259